MAIGRDNVITMIAVSTGATVLLLELVMLPLVYGQDLESAIEIIKIYEDGTAYKLFANGT
jgi:hypothetical protein